MSRRPRLGGPGEVAQEEATGVVAAAYEEIRSVLGEPFVPTLYRMLAMHPAVLVPAVDRLRPLLQQPPAKDFLLRARHVVRAALPTLGDRHGLVVDERLLARYLRVNPPGLLFVLALLGREADQQPRVMSPPLPAVEADVWRDIQSAHGGVTIPGFWRELGSAPDLLGPMWAAARSQAERGGFDEAREAALQLGVGALAEMGVRPLLDDMDPGEAAVVRKRLLWFPNGIATMMAETEWLMMRTAPGQAGHRGQSSGR